MSEELYTVDDAYQELEEILTILIDKMALSKEEVLFKVKEIFNDSLADFP